MVGDIKNICLDILLDLSDLGYHCHVFTGTIPKFINIVIESGFDLDSPSSSDAVSRVIDFLDTEGYQKTLYKQKTHCPTLLQPLIGSGTISYTNTYEWKFVFTKEDKPF